MEASSVEFWATAMGDAAEKSKTVRKSLDCIFEGQYVVSISQKGVQNLYDAKVESLQEQNRSCEMHLCSEISLEIECNGNLNCEQQLLYMRKGWW